MRGDQPFVIVTGAGRSGTSAVARVLHESGVPMGRELAAPSSINPRGFYEDRDVLALNERILRELGAPAMWQPAGWHLGRRGRPCRTWHSLRFSCTERWWKTAR